MEMLFFLCACVVVIGVTALVWSASKGDQDGD